MKPRLLALLVFIAALLAPAAQATDFYFANAGSDSAACTIKAPCQTIAKANQIALSTAQPGDRIMLKAYDIFRDATLLCGSQYQNTGTATLTSNPPPCRNVTIARWGDTSGTAILDAADPLPGIWTPVTGTTWQQVLPAGTAVPKKLFVDATFNQPTSPFGQMLLPVPNYVGTCSSSTTYYFLDAINSSGALALQSSITPITGCSSIGVPGSSTFTASWQKMPGVGPAIALQGFAVTSNTGLQNVELGAAAFAPQLPGFGYPTYPGVWYVSGVPGSALTLYVNLADGSNPNSHTWEATNRDYNLVVEGTNDVRVTGLTLAHANQDCFLTFPYSDTDYVGENIEIDNSIAFNCGGLSDQGMTEHTAGSNYSPVRGDYVFKPSGATQPLLVRNPAVLNSIAGTVDTLFGQDTTVSSAIYMNSADEGGPLNRCAICGNLANSTNASGIMYTTANIPLRSGALLQSMGGRVANNEATNNQSNNINFTSVYGGLVESNFIHDSYGQGIQIGGSSYSFDNGPAGPGKNSQVIRFNRIANLGVNAGFGDFNGIDGNSATVLLSAVYEYGNLIVNVYAACMTAEGTYPFGVTAWYNFQNLCDQNHNYFGNGAKSASWTPSTQTPNASNGYYTSGEYGTSPYGMWLHQGWVMHDNWIILNAAQTSVLGSGRTCATFLAFAPDTTSTCPGADPQLVNPAIGTSNVSLKSTSPLIGAAKSGATIGFYAPNPNINTRNARLTGNLP